MTYTKSQIEELLLVNEPLPREEKIDIVMAILSINPRERHVVLMKWLGFSFRDIGKSLDFSKDTASRRFKDGVMEMTQILNGTIPLETTKRKRRTTY